MFNKKLLLLLSSLFLITACNEDLKTTFFDANITTQNNKLVEVNIPNAVGNNLVSTKINAEITKLIISELHVGELDNITSKSVEESVALFNKEYNDFNAEFPNSTAPWEAQIDGEVLFNSNEIISIAITSYTNTGGAHGNTNISIINFNASTGNQILNKNLFKNEIDFKAAAKPYFEAAIKENDIQFETYNFQLPANIGYNDEGVILLYNTYEIAPYTTGIINFTIPFEKVSSILIFDGSK